MAWLNRVVGWVKRSNAPKEAPPTASALKKPPARKVTSPPKPAFPKSAPPKAKKPALVKKAPPAEKAPARRDPMSDSQKLLIQGQQHQHKGDLKGAMAHYNKAIELDPGNYEAYTNRGVAREATGDVKGAKSDYTKSIELQVNDEINRQLDSQ